MSKYCQITHIGVLGCIHVDFCEFLQVTILQHSCEIYNIHTLLHLSEVKMLANILQTYRQKNAQHFPNQICKKK